jgi:DNA-binding response OmpR family regulator
MGNKSILVIDDDAELCEEIAEILQGEGYSVENTSDTAEGENLLKEHSYDIVILDFKMQDLNGIDILKKIKAKDPTTKVCMISGRPFIEKLLEEEKVSHMVDGVINKPFDGKALIEKIGKMI